MRNWQDWESEIFMRLNKKNIERNSFFNAKFLKWKDRENEGRREFENELI